jgi:hypothetical protein
MGQASLLFGQPAGILQGLSQQVFQMTIEASEFVFGPGLQGLVKIRIQTEEIAFFL